MARDKSGWAERESGRKNSNLVFAKSENSNLVEFYRGGTREAKRVRFLGWRVKKNFLAG